MYLSKLSPDEKVAFFNLAYKLVAFNGIEPEEHALLMGAVAEMGLRRVERPASVDIEAECGKFHSPAARRIALLELMTLSLADGSFQKEEQHLTQQILRAFGIDDTEIEAVLGWADAWFAVYSDGHDFIELGPRKPAKSTSA